MTKMATRRAKRARLEARATAAQKALLERAAALSGQSLSDFVITNAVRRAEELLREQMIVSLSVRDSAAFAEAILDASGPNAALREASGLHDELIQGT